MLISIKAETLFQVGGLNITNALFTTWVTMLVLIIVAFIVKTNLKAVPSKLQSILEATLEFLLNIIDVVTGSREISKKFFPLLVTLFLFIVTANWLALLPGFGSIVFKHGNEVVPLFRGANADLNTTIALALIASVAIQVTGFKYQGFRYLTKFVNFHGVSAFFVGILELVSEITKPISFAFRLFGNIFAGEVLLVVVTSLIPILAPTPFIALEIFVGFIQGLVFSMLTLIFLRLTMTSH